MTNCKQKNYRRISGTSFDVCYRNHAIFVKVKNFIVGQSFQTFVNGPELDLQEGV